MQKPFFVRRAFTFTETMVVTASIGVMLSLVLPAIYHSLGSWRSISCSRNIKHLAMGLNAYHDIHGNYPPSIEASPNNGNQHPSWGIRVLPHIGEQGLYDTFDLSQPILATFGPQQPIWPHRNAIATETDLAVMRCPADEWPSPKYKVRVAFRSVAQGGSIYQYWARGNYAANACQTYAFDYGATCPLGGGVMSAAAANCGHPRSHGWAGCLGMSLKGVMGANVSVPQGSITDGLASTILLSEIKAGLTYSDPRGIWALGRPAANSLWNHSYGPNSCYDTLGLGNNDLAPFGIHYLLGDGDAALGREIARAQCMEAFNEGSVANAGHPRSAHEGGIFAAMCDGSVRFVKNNIQRGLHPAYWSGHAPPQEGAIGVWERLNLSTDGLFVDPQAEGAPAFVLGDMDGDGDVDNFDMRAFSLALTNADEYFARYHLLDYRERGDINQDGVFDNFDSQPFSELLTRQR